MSQGYQWKLGKISRRQLCIEGADNVVMTSHTASDITSPLQAAGPPYPHDDPLLISTVVISPQLALWTLSKPCSMTC